MNVTLHIPHTAAVVNVASFIVPGLKPKYSLSGEDFEQGPLHGGSGPHVQIARTGKYVVIGTVKDAKGQPVEGASVQLGKTTVYTDSSGKLFTRFKHHTEVSVSVNTEDFTTPGHWRTVSAPRTVTPSPDQDASQLVIVVETF